MRYAVISDIHGNLEAFTAVLEDIEKRGGADRIWCLGDTVDYGPDPHECIELLRRIVHVAVAGNHDLVAVGKLDTAGFHPDAIISSRWTSRQLSPGDVEYLSSLPLVIEESGFTLVHASPRNPAWEYLNTPDRAEENLTYFKSSFCLVGHTHKPCIFCCEENSGCSTMRFPDEFDLAQERGRMILNPGSIGQPRDNDPRASYAVYDSERRVVCHYRVEYDIASTQAKMLECGLPAELIARLSFGV